MKTPELKTSRLTLKPYTTNLVSAQHVVWLNDPEIMRYSEQRHYSHSIESQKCYADLMLLSPNTHAWLIVAEHDVGTVSLYKNALNQVGDMGILIGDKSVWGKGYATEAWKAVMDWGFGELGLRKIECGCMSPNLAMRQVATKTGMKIDGGRKDHFLLDDKPVDAVYYGKMR